MNEEQSGDKVVPNESDFGSFPGSPIVNDEELAEMGCTGTEDTVEYNCREHFGNKMKLGSRFFYEIDIEKNLQGIEGCVTSIKICSIINM